MRARREREVVMKAEAELYERERVRLEELMQTVSGMPREVDSDQDAFWVLEEVGASQDDYAHKQLKPLNYVPSNLGPPPYAPPGYKPKAMTYR